MNVKELRAITKKLRGCFPKFFLNDRIEAIIEPNNNIYFRMEDVESEFDVKVKIINWCSRSCTKGVSLYFQKYMRKGVNAYLETNFTEREFNIIYGKLGNGINKDLTIKFIESYYDFDLLMEREER